MDKIIVYTVITTVMGKMDIGLEIPINGSIMFARNPINITLNRLKPTAKSNDLILPI
jgi:hypothetical protein